MRPYVSKSKALTDVLRLARAMTFKAALANVPVGGGKAVIIADPKRDKSAAMFRAFGRFVNSFQGRYYTGEDVGTAVEDMAWVAEETPYVVGTAQASGDPAPLTAYGVYLGIRTALGHAFGLDRVRGRRVAIQGLGHVGYELCARLAKSGANLVVADIDHTAVERACQAFGAVPVGSDQIYDVDADVFAPCALGGVLNDDTIPRLRCAVVAGAANNQLREARDGENLYRRGILYAPDYVINAGGLINASLELEPSGYDRTKALTKVAAIQDTLAKIFALAEYEGTATNRVAERLGRQRLAVALENFQLLTQGDDLEL